VAARVAAIEDRQRRSDVAASTQILAGLRFNSDVVHALFRGGFMRESVIYQEILKEGERKGLREGEQKGLREGERKEALTFVLHLLSYKLGRVDEATQQRIQNLERVQLEQLGVALLSFATFSDLDAWLKATGY